MINGINNTQIEQIVDTHLASMFNPKANVSPTEKSSIKSQAMKLAESFESIISEYNSDNHSDDFIDRVINKIDSFIEEYDELINSITHKNEASAVGSIWYSFFTKAQNELSNNVSDKMIFEYGESKLNKLLIARIKKK
jgi:enoyl-[acyl-carrier-protein] reductase (NADH)